MFVDHCDRSLFSYSTVGTLVFFQPHAQFAERGDRPTHSLPVCQFQVRRHPRDILDRAIDFGIDACLHIAPYCVR